MATVIDLDDVQRHSEDLDELRARLLRVIGKPFLFFRASYGDELTLHLGGLVPYPSPKMKDVKRGTFIVAARTSSWILEPGTVPAHAYMSGIEFRGSSARSEQLELREIEKRSTIRPGAIVTHATTSTSPLGLILALTFSDGSSMVLLPVPPDDEDEGEPLSNWEIFMPRHRILKVGPGASWSYTDSSRARPAEEASPAP